MKEKPILFSGPLVRAILDGRKTQTRRPVKPQLPDKPTLEHGKRWGRVDGNFYYCGVRCPFGVTGDRLWVRETWSVGSIYDHLPPREIDQGAKVAYPADAKPRGLKGRPSIHMPRWASRINLLVTGVRAERLQQMSFNDWRRDFLVTPREEEQALASFTGAKFQGEHMQSRWDAIYEDKYPYGSNPWVWVVGFERIS